MHLYLFGLILSCNVLLLCGMEQEAAESKLKKQKITIKVPLSVQKRVVPLAANLQGIGVHGIGSLFEICSPPPPLPLPQFWTIPDRQPMEIELEHLEDDLPEIDLDAAMQEWLDTLPDRRLYLVRYDVARLRYICFESHSRQEIIVKYLMHVANDSLAHEHATIMSICSKLPLFGMQQKHQHYSIACSMHSCGTILCALSVEKLKATLMVHYILCHEQQNALYRSIDSRIKFSFEEALAALKGLSL